jgi:DNA-binding LacI/PurR family transcriptional regulator
MVLTPPKRVTIRDVAQLAEVSLATASYVLSASDSPRARVSQATRERVRNAAQALDYRPNSMARSVRTGRTGVIQLVLHMLSDPWTVGIAETVTERAPEHGLTALIAVDTDYSAALQRVEFDSAFVAAAVGATPEECVAALGPVAKKVAIYSPILEPVGFDVVRFDDHLASEIAMRHLLTDHRAIALLTTRSDGGGDARRDVYESTMRSAGLPIPPGYFMFCERDLVDPYRVAQRLLTRPDRPTAVFASADFIGYAVMQAARELGLRVPEDVAVIGIGDAKQSAAVGLSSVGSADLGEQIADFVIARALDDATPDNRLLDLRVELFARSSTVRAGS